MTSTPDLVAAAFEHRKEIARIQAELIKVEEQLIALGPGKYAAPDGRTVTVVADVAASTGAISYALADESTDKARELVGEAFRKLFDRKEIFTPCEGFEHVAPKLLTPAKARDLLTLCCVPGKSYSGKRAHVRYP